MVLSPGARSASSIASSAKQSTASRWSSASAPSRTVDRRFKAEPSWAQQHGAPSLYIGPWQEFALGRALKQTHQRKQQQQQQAPQAPTEQLLAGVPQQSTSSYSVASSSAASAKGPGELSQFVAAFKEMADHLDEESAKNLLAWSPLFLPTVENLMRPDGTFRPPKSKIRGPLPKEVRHPAPHPRVQAAAAERLEHIAKMRQMYGVGMVGGAEEMAGRGSAPPPSAAAHGAASANGTTQQLRGRGDGGTAPGAFPAAPPQSTAAAAVGDDLGDLSEDEVDDLLQWTTDLAVPDDL